MHSSFIRLAVFLAVLVPAPVVRADTFTNPLLPSGPDPSVAYRDGYYYYMNTTAVNLTIWKTRDITDLQHAEKRVVWTPPATGAYSHDIWAPELHLIRGKWYIYFAADAKKNVSHRIWVLQNASKDPLQGQWKMKGELTDSTDKWAIDATVFENKHRLYALWSGWEGDVDGTQNIYIARLSNPWTVKGPRVKVSSPQFAWEIIGDLPQEHRHVNVNEGPEILKHAGKLFLVYSASGCWTDTYALGMLVADNDSDLLDAGSWKKMPEPVFSQSPEAQAFGTGHNTFFQSRDGKQDWILYHANSEPGKGCGRSRSPRAQPFTWNSDGSPNFGKPIPLTTRIAKPE